MTLNVKMTTSLQGRPSCGSRHAAGFVRLGCSQKRLVQLSVVCMGRNDGASSGKRRGQHSSSRRQHSVPNPATEPGLWYDRKADQVASSSGYEASPSGRQGNPSSSWERAGGQSNRGPAKPDRRSRADDDDSDDDEDTRGWWERPEESSLQAFAAPALEPWQEERLQLAYASGRRKVQIQELARELDVDRTVVIGWFKEFSLKPANEREAILTARRGEEAARRATQASRNAVEAATGQMTNDARIAAAANPRDETPSGFIPYYLRKQLGVDKQKRINGEVLRTLESIYDRTPFPSKDVIKGLYDLHRLSREVAAEWFAARRAADGITSSTEKRAARESQRHKDRNLDAAFTGPVDGRDRRQGNRPYDGPYGGPGSSGESLLSGLAGQAQGPGQPEQPAEPTVVTLSRREMAALRSSLPSRNKHKGRQLAEKMGIKSDPDSQALQIGDVQYVADTPDPATRADQMRASWRFRAATARGGPGPAAGAAGGRRVRLRGRAAGRGAGSESEEEER